MTPPDTAAALAAALERQVLGALLHGQPVAPIRALMPAEEFSTGTHQLIADAIYGLADAGRPVCPTGLLDELFERRQVGRIDAVLLIVLYERCELPASGVYFAERARRYAILRRLRTLGQQLAHATTVTDLDDIGELCRIAFTRIATALDHLTPPAEPVRLRTAA